MACKWYMRVDEDGTKTYFNNKAQKHRLDGPAVERGNGTKEWWLNDEKLTEEQFNQRVSRCRDIEFVREQAAKLGYSLVEVEKEKPQDNQGGDITNLYATYRVPADLFDLLFGRV